MHLRYFFSCLLTAILLCVCCVSSDSIPNSRYTTELPLPPAGSTPLHPRSISVQYTPDYPLHFIGDSRTVGMMQALRTQGSIPEFTEFTAKIGQGYHWLTDQTALTGTSPSILLLNLGVNDLGNCSSYQALYEQYAGTCWKDCPIYIISVNPCCSPCTGVTNTSIEAFNTSMQAWVDTYNANIPTASPDTENVPADARTLPVYYIDTYHYLTETGYSSSDGLHYSADTYLRLYHFILEQIVEPVGDGSGTYTVSSCGKFISQVRLTVSRIRIMNNVSA